MFYCENTSQVSNVTSSPVSDNLHCLFLLLLFVCFFWLKIRQSFFIFFIFFFLTLLHEIHLGMQNNRCGPGQSIKDIGSEVCVSVCVCVCVCECVCVGKLPRQMV